MPLSLYMFFIQQQFDSGEFMFSVPGHNFGHSCNDDENKSHNQESEVLIYTTFTTGMNLLKTCMLVLEQVSNVKHNLLPHILPGCTI